MCSVLFAIYDDIMINHFFIVASHIIALKTSSHSIIFCLDSPHYMYMHLLALANCAL